MTFTEQDKLKALAIVSIFETSKPFGSYAACVVLNDGAGVSYGIAQFTHRSGSLWEVVDRYLNAGGQIGREVLAAAIPLLKRNNVSAIERLASDTRFKKALIAAAVTREMKEAQHFVATTRYLRPAIDICTRMGFSLPLSLAVVYDSVVHGSWERIAGRVGTRTADEKAWITEYVRKRHIWLTAIVRLRSTTYRTRFFLNQIATGNWYLKLPLIVHGVKLSEPSASAGGTTAVGGSTVSKPTDVPSPAPLPPAHAGGSDLLATAASNFDRIDGVVTGVVTRTDRAKSLWTTVIGTLSQALWAIFGFFAGLPREVWIVVALIAAAFMLFFLHRQLVLGRIREQLTTDHRQLLYERHKKHPHRLAQLDDLGPGRH
ncbi:MAG: chitosanase [Pyrinomonadaceae bacterium]|nr:chitosanase [Pyrinomonadaceae bacterium]MBP9110820.1 chitosanase [Pyrinomonadaceae bacterium]